MYTKYCKGSVAGIKYGKYTLNNKAIKYNIKVRQPKYSRMQV